MGGGKHNRQNPRGSPSGRKLAGDQLAEKVHGRKGMYKPQREKGPSRRAIESDDEVTVKNLDRDEFQILWLLSTRGKYCPSTLSWDDVVLELSALGMVNASMEADGFLSTLASKTNGWLKYVSYYSLCLNGEHAREIHEFQQAFLQASKDEEE